MRRLVALTAAVFVAEAALYSAITPLLAHYAETIGISKVAAGVLNATYAAGLIPGSLLAGWLSGRIGVRALTIGGVVAFAATAAAFGAVDRLVALDVIRAAQGVAAGCMWGGALAWLIGAAPRERRGEYLGAAFGVSIFGSLLGPLIGIVAVAVGSELAFGVSGIAIAALTVPLLNTPPPAVAAVEPRAPLTAVGISRQLRFGIWLIALSALAFGLMSTLLPLRLEGAGASPAAVGATFLVASLFAALTARRAGTMSDRRGALPLSRLGLVLATPLLAGLAFDAPPTVLALLTIGATGVALTGIGVPASRLLTDAAEEAGLTSGVSVPLLLLSLSLGEVVGATAGAVLAAASGDAAPFLVLGSLTALSLIAAGGGHLERFAPGLTLPRASSRGGGEPASARPRTGREPGTRVRRSPKAR
jgi:MFS family permease